MPWWKFWEPNPADLHAEATRTAGAWWQEAGQYTDRFIELGPVRVRLFLCGSHAILKKEFLRRHLEYPVEGFGEGYFWANDGVTPGIDQYTEAEIWLVEKNTGKNGIIHKWAGGHELMRLVDLLCRLQRGAEFGDAGKTDRPEYYG